MHITRKAYTATGPARVQFNLWNFIYVFLFSGGMFFYMADVLSSGPNTVPQALTYAFWLPLYAIAGIYFIFHLRLFLSTIPKMMFAWSMCFLAFISFFWSVSPTETFFSAVILLGTVLISAFIVMNFKIEEFASYFCIAQFINAALSILILFFDRPHAYTNLAYYGVMMDGMTFDGLWPEKNIFGQNMCLAGVFSLYLAFKRNNRFYKIMAPAFAVMTVCSQSKTALVSLTLAYSVIILNNIFKDRKNLVILYYYIVFVAIVVGFFLVKTDAGFILKLIGKDETLTGRTEIWKYTLQVFDKSKSLLGYGYNVFWNGFDSPADQVWDAIGYRAKHAHNAWVETYVNFGLVGVITCTAFMGYYALTSFVRSVRTAEHILILALFVAVLTISFSEAVFMSYNHIVTIVIFALCGYVHRKDLSDSQHFQRS